MVSRLRLFAVFLITVFFLVEIPAQERNPKGESEEVNGIEGEQLDDGDFNFGETFLTLLVPPGVKNTWRLKRFLRSEKFSHMKVMDGELRAIDAVYRRALEISNGDLSEALFICTLGTMEHRKVGVKLPLIKLPVYLPLTSESDSAFRIRVSDLPSHFYIDSPRDEFGDKDKLQHFFGSAFLAYSFRSRALAEFVGDFVEWGEEEFIIDGAADVRDRRANHQGREFGLALGERADAHPSEFLQIQLVLTGSRFVW